MIRLYWATVSPPSLKPGVKPWYWYHNSTLIDLRYSLSLLVHVEWVPAARLSHEHLQTVNYFVKCPLPVSLIQHQYLDCLQVEGGGIVQVIYQPSWGCYDNIRILSEGGLLALAIKTTWNTCIWWELAIINSCVDVHTSCFWARAVVSLTTPFMLPCLQYEFHCVNICSQLLLYYGGTSGVSWRRQGVGLVVDGRGFLSQVGHFCC